MSKSQVEKRTIETSSNSSRSRERELLAEAIHIRDEQAAEDEVLRQARERARADRFLANRDVEAAERALAHAREAERSSLVDAYVGGDEDDGQSAVAEAEAALARAQKRLADLRTIAAELDAHTGPAPGRSIPGMRVDEAVRAVVRTHPTIRRLVEDWQTAERAFRMYEATLIHLGARGMLPDDLVSIAPSKNSTRYAEPDPLWISAIEALKHSADAGLP